MRQRATITALFFLAFAATPAFASPPPNFSQQVYLCNTHLQANVSIVFGQTATSATVSTTSGPVKRNPWVWSSGLPANADYSVFVGASTRPNSDATWSIASTQQDGFIGAAQPDISIGNSAFASPTCNIKGTVILSAACPDASGMKRDYVVVERNWVGCGR